MIWRGAARDREAATASPSCPGREPIGDKLPRERAWPLRGSGASAARSIGLAILLAAAIVLRADAHESPKDSPADSARTSSTAAAGAAAAGADAATAAVNAAGAKSTPARTGTLAKVLATAAGDDSESRAGRAVAALIVNGEAQGEVPIIWRGGHAWVPVSALRDAGLQIGKAHKLETIDGVLHLDVESLWPDLEAEWDDEDVALRLTASADLLASHVIELGSARPKNLARSRPPSAFMNYALTADTAGRGATAAMETGISLRGWLLRTGILRDGVGRWTRGTSVLTKDDERRMRRWEVGDLVLAGGAIGGAVAALGVAVSKEFGIDPYFIRYEPLMLSGAVTTPSTADVYVNGQLVARQSLAPGSFSLRGLPGQVGAGRAEVVLRDAFGREQRLASSFYQPASLLRQGLHQYRYGIGLRQVSQLQTTDRFMVGAYNGVAAQAEHRIGVRDWLTLGGRFEGTDDMVGAAPEIAVRAPIGEFSLSVAGSRTIRAGRDQALSANVDRAAGVDLTLPISIVTNGELAGASIAASEILAAAQPDRNRNGAAIAAAWSYRGRIVTAGVAMRGATSLYRTLDQGTVTLSSTPIVIDPAATVGGGTIDPATGVALGATTAEIASAAGFVARPRALRTDVQAYAGTSLPHGISLTVQHAETRDWSGDRSRRSTLSASWPAGTWGNVTTSVSRVRIDARPQWEAFVGLNVRLGTRSSVDTSWRRDGDRSVPAIAYQRSLPIGPGIGARVQYEPGWGQIRSDRSGAGGGAGAAGGSGSGGGAGVGADVGAGADVAGSNLARSLPPASDAIDARLQLQGTVGRIELRHVTIGGAPSSSINLTGGLVALGGRVRMTRTIDDAFGLIRVPGVRGVRAYLSNQFVGRTDARGDLVVPGLVSYYGNRLSIEPEDLPFDRELGANERIVAPSWRGGALARFDAPRVRPISGRLVIVAGERQFVPAFGDVSIDLDDRRITSPIDAGGEFYLDDPGSGYHRLMIRYKGLVYTCGFVVPAGLRDEAWTMDVGLVTCRAQEMMTAVEPDPADRRRRAEAPQPQSKSGTQPEQQRQEPKP